MIDLSKKLKIAMAKKGITQSQLAELTAQSRANLSGKMIANNFKLSEYERLVNAMDCELEINIVFPNGDKV
jgi:transcriptional regulator with XRE-family HTH domain